VQLAISDMIVSAGPVGQLVMLTLLLFSVASWTIVIMKARLFKKVRLDSEDFLETFWNSANLNEAHAAAAQYQFSPQASVFIAGFAELQKINKIRNRQENHPGEEKLDMQLATMDNLKRAIRKAQSEMVSQMGKNLPFLATTGSATPFIGLFGTVWGIMVSFHDIGQRGSASLAVVAPGISEAFSNKLDLIDGEVDSFSIDFLNLVERDLLGRV